MGGKAAIRRQFLTSFCCNLLTVSCGTSNGWATTCFLPLQAKESTFPTGPLKIEEATLVLSLLCVGGFTGNFIFLFLSKYFGRKKIYFWLAIPQITGWLLVIFAQNVYYLYASRVIFGIAMAAICVGIPIYLAEISHDKYRGAINSIFDPAHNFGVVLAFVLGNYFDYRTQAQIHLFLPILFLILFTRIPDSPNILLKKRKLKAAEKSFKFFKGSGIPPENDIFLKQSENPDEELNKTNKDEIELDENNSKLTLSDFVTHRSLKSLFIVLTSLMLSMLSGTIVITTYITAIFEEVGSKLSTNDSSILVVLIQLIANIIIVYIIDKAGRRILFISSAILCTIGYCVIGFYVKFLAHNQTYNWIPIVIISLILFISTLGMVPIPFMIMIEIFPKKVRYFGITFCISTMWLVSFVLTETYPWLKGSIGLFGCFIAFAGLTTISALFGTFFIPETKGKSYEAIMLSLD